MQSSTLCTTEASSRSPRRTSSSVTRSDCCICWNEVTSCWASLLRDREAGPRRSCARPPPPSEAASSRSKRMRSSSSSGTRQVGGRLAAEQLAHDRLRFLVAHVVVDEPLDLGRGQDGGRPRRGLLLAGTPTKAAAWARSSASCSVSSDTMHEDGDVDEERPEDPVAEVSSPARPRSAVGRRHADARRPLGQERRRRARLP